MDKFFFAIQVNGEKCFKKNIHNLLWIIIANENRYEISKKFLR